MILLFFINSFKMRISPSAEALHVKVRLNTLNKDFTKYC